MHVKDIVAVALIITVFIACTKTEAFYKEDSISSIKINTTSAKKAFWVWLDDQLLKDSLTGTRELAVNVVAGKHRLRIQQTGSENYFIDTTLVFDWTEIKPSHIFSLIELNPSENPLLFAEFPTTIPAHENGFITFAIINMDTTYTFNKTVDMLLYDVSDPEKLLFELNNIPYGKISDYFKVAVADFNNGGLLVIKESATGNLLLDGRPNWNMGFFYPTTYNNNTFLLKYENGGSREYPYYFGIEIFSSKR